MSDIFNGYGVEVNLVGDSFLKVKETLTRIGVATSDKKLFQSCHILHKQGRYAVMQFKELFALDGRESSLSDDDIRRRNQIVKLLVEWNLVSLVGDGSGILDSGTMSNIKVIPHKDKSEWNLISKYTIGTKKRVVK